MTRRQKRTSPTKLASQMACTLDRASGGVVHIRPHVRPVVVASKCAQATGTATTHTQVCECAISSPMCGSCMRRKVCDENNTAVSRVQLRKRGRKAINWLDECQPWDLGGSLTRAACETRTFHSTLNADDAHCAVVQCDDGSRVLFDGLHHLTLLACTVPQRGTRSE
jgi:hypothetical protein